MYKRVNYISNFIIVLSGEPAVTTPTTEYEVNIGDPLTMTCTVTAYPQHTIVYWKYIEGVHQSM